MLTRRPPRTTDDPTSTAVVGRRINPPHEYLDRLFERRRVVVVLEAGYLGGQSAGFVLVGPAQPHDHRKAGAVDLQVFESADYSARFDVDRGEVREIGAADQAPQAGPLEHRFGGQVHLL